MSLNWSSGVIIGFLSTIPVIVAFFASIHQYKKEKHSFLVYFALMWFSLFIWIFFQALSDLLLDIYLHLVCFYGMILMGFFTIFFVDSVTRDSSDPVKIVLMTIASVMVVVFSFKPKAVIMNTTGAPYPTMNGIFKWVALVQMGILLSFLVYGNLKLFLNTPQNLKFHSTINLLGTAVFGILPIIIQFTHLEQKIPGIATGSLAIGMCMVSYAFIKQPKLAYILPFRVYQLSVLESTQGKEMFTFQWKGHDKILDEEIFLSLMKGIGPIFEDMINLGKPQEIQLDQARLFLEQAPDIPITCVLVSNKVNKSLRSAFHSFSLAVFELVRTNSDGVSSEETNKKIEDMVKKYFPFIPNYT